MSRTLTAGLILLAVLAIGVALSACWLEVFPLVGTRGNPDRACLPLAPSGLDAFGGLQYTAKGAISLLPFGLTCSFTSADGRVHAGFGPSWTPTLLMLVAFGLAVVTVFVARGVYRQPRS